MADEDERAAKRMRLKVDFIVVNVGTDAVESFTVHEDVIKKHSVFFRKALDKKWDEGQKREINLPEDDKDVVAAYLAWLYDSRDIGLPEFSINGSYRYHLLATCYIFGEKVQDSEFCNHIVDIICKCMGTPRGQDDLISASRMLRLWTVEGWEKVRRPKSLERDNNELAAKEKLHGSGMEVEEKSG